MTIPPMGYEYAFPSGDSTYGMDIRTYIATRLMASLLVNVEGRLTPEGAKNIAEQANVATNALLKELVG